MSRPRIRSLKPESWQDEGVGALSLGARLLFIGLITLADDEGRLRAQPSMLIGSVFPWDEVAPRQIVAWLEEIQRERLVLLYEDAGKPYAAFRNWKRHQRINKPTVSVMPPPPNVDVVQANSVITTGSEPTISPTPVAPSRARGSDRIGEEGEREDVRASHPYQPVLDVLAQCSRLHVDVVGVENAIASWPERDPVRAARSVVTWATDPTFRSTNAARLLVDALSKQTPEKLAAVSEKDATTARRLAAIQSLGGAA